MESISKKNYTYRVSIRKEQIQSFIKDKRKQMLGCLQSQKECSDNYWNLLNYTSIQNLIKMDKQTLGNHLQMLVEIVSLQEIAPYYEQLQPLLCTIVQFFEFSYNSWFKSIQIQENLLQEAQKEQIVPLVVMNKMLAFINPNQLTKLIGSIYYEIVPHNLSILRKTLILMRQMLAFSMKDACVLSDFLTKVGEPTNLAQDEVNRNSILLVLMNITSAEDDSILDIVYQESIIQNISQWVEVYGFSEQQKQSICGIYSNMIQYLCNYAPSVVSEPSMQERLPKEYNLFLSIFQDLAKQQSSYIREKMVYVGVQLIDCSSQHNLECKEYLLELCEEIMRGIVQNNQYCEGMEDLFIVFIKQNRINGHITWLLEFLRIALNNYTYAYYGFKEKEKKKQSSTEANLPRPKCLQNISKLINTCELMLAQEPLLSNSQTQTECQQEIVQQLVDFWCKEELEPLQQQFLSFMATALEAEEELSRFCFQNQQICEVLFSLVNCSYQFPNEVEMAMRLTSIILGRLSQMTQIERTGIMRQWDCALKEIKFRLQDYATMVVNGSGVKIAEVNLTQLNQLLPPELGL